jgi:hypothetical protein
MPEFDDVRRRLSAARDAIAKVDDDLFAVREQLRQIAEREIALARVSGQDAADAGSRNERARLAHERAAAEQQLEQLRRARGDLVASEGGLAATFATFTDPRRGITSLSDRTPILLMPLRLETRFREVSVPSAPAPTHELWVRIYPDDCWIDTFDATPTEAEIGNVRTYWLDVWQAGKIAAQEQAAWRVLVGKHGSGRAAWLADQYQPVNLADRPAKSQATDLILTIAVEAPGLAAAEAVATATFWRVAWLANGDASRTATARAALEAAVGAARAGEIITQYQPVNFTAQPTNGMQRADLHPTVAFVVFSAVADTKTNSWARAPKMAILPDRFVFLGYRSSDPPTVVLGNPVPPMLFVAPDPSASASEQLQHDAHGDLIIPDQLQWITDFERAVQDGMAMRIPLNAVQAASGFDRVLVLGLRLNPDVTATQTEVETLLRHHYYSRTGLSVVPQGTPTNNTDALGSGYSRGDDADASFADRKAPLFTVATDWLDKRDGQWLAEALGIDPTLCARLHHADMTDQLAARAMSVALWPATLGYWMETMLAPVFTTEAIAQTRRFFSRYVLGAGAVPALQIGKQPYGILPATAFSRMTWMNPDGTSGRPPDPDRLLPFLQRLYPILLAIDRDWRTAVPSSSLPRLGADSESSGDPHATLLDVIALHSGSVQWSQRYAESFDSLFNRLQLQGFGGAIQAIILAKQRELSRQTLTNLGYAGADTPLILNQVFSGAQLPLNGGVVDDRPLSETAAIRGYTATNANYLQWLIDAANTSLDALYQQNGFTDDKPPNAILYLILRHALQLGYYSVSLQLYEAAGLITPAQASTARGEAPFLHVREVPVASESRYQMLYATQPAITGNPTQTVGSFIGGRLQTLTAASSLREQIAALERLKALPTARLERAFADHIDACAYRLDAWLQAIVTYQLVMMRQVAGEEAQAQRGLHLGGYAWLEDLRPEARELTPVALTDPGLIADFGGPNQPALVRDSTNQGYVHAPSLNQAVAAAVLRNGFITNATPQNPGTMAVTLTSERVRTALGLIEGMRGGQSLADLLGYRFERGLHDRHGLAEVDRFIAALRREFPLRGDRMQSTKPPEGVAIESLEARNVIDGLAFVQHLLAGHTTYPFDKPNLPQASPEEAKAIEAEGSALLEAHDALADLALSEGVYQAVLGNYDRVAATYDAYARGQFPPEPDVVRTPQNGIGVTARVALHLAAQLDPTVSPTPGLPMTPRAQAEPAINAWLSAMLPPLDQIACVVTFRAAGTGMPARREVTLRHLDLQPADLVAIVRNDASQAMTELDDRIVHFAVTQFSPRPDVPVAIEYMATISARLSVFQTLPLLRALHRLVTLSRPLTATDLALSGEASTTEDSAPSADPRPLMQVRNALEALQLDLATFAAALQSTLSDPVSHRTEILAQVDDYVVRLAVLLATAATFGIPQSGWGFAYDARRRAFDGILQQVAAVVTRWTARLTEFDALMAAHDALDSLVSDAEHYRLLQQAERLIATAPITPLPPTWAQFSTTLRTVTRPAFVAKQREFAAVATTTRARVAELRTDVLALLPYDAFDITEFTLAAQEDAMVQLAEDALRVATTILGNIERRLLESQDHLDAATATAVAGDRVAAYQRAAQSLLGDDFHILLRFSLAPARGNEFAQALALAETSAPFEHLTHPVDPSQALDFPIDTWLHGVARVRDKMHALEQTILMTGALGVTEPALTAVQLPVIAGDAWLGLDLKPGQTLDRERLLYTAHFAAPFDKTVPQCGLLLDEWAELIPSDAVDTGITFHHDRPNSEAPQAMLLVTPTQFRGAWQWNDLVDALNETLDLAKRRAIEPKHLDAMPYAPFLPATVMASQARQLTIAANLALNNDIVLASQGD